MSCDRIHVLTGEGVQWSNLNSGVSVDDNLSMLVVMIMLIFDAVLYMLVALYIEAVFPGSYGIPQPWYFFVMVGVPN